MIFCINAFYFFPKPEAFLQTIYNKAPKIILGCYNGGHWSYRLRYLFGRGPCPSVTHYSIPYLTNYEEMRRFWTLRDHKFVFKSLGYKSQMIAAKSDATSLHKKPYKFLSPNLSALGFIFLLEPEEQALSK